MLSSFDMESYGLYLRKLRESLGYTRNDIYERTGISENTLSRLEKGESIPQIVTLTILSEVYGENLLLAFDTFKDDHPLNSCIEKLDKAILTSNVERANQVLDEIQIQRDASNFSYYDDSDMNRLIQYAHLLIQSFKENTNISLNTIHALEALLSSNFSSYDVFFKSKSSTISNLEIRILITIGCGYQKTSNFELSHKILTFVLSRLKLTSYPKITEQKLLMRTYSNLLYNHHYLDQHDELICLAEEAIAYARRHSLMYLLYFIYFRKGLAEFLLHQDHYLESFYQGIALLKINGDDDLAESFVKVAKNQYGIQLTTNFNNFQ